MFFFLFLFFLSGAQNLFSSGLNFVTISPDSSHVKNQFLGPSRVRLKNPFEPSSPFFLLFFSPVFCFCLELPVVYQLVTIWLSVTMVTLLGSTEIPRHWRCGNTTPRPKGDHTTETRTPTRSQTNGKRKLAPTENFWFAPHPETQPKAKHSEHRKPGVIPMRMTRRENRDASKHPELCESRHQSS